MVSLYDLPLELLSMIVECNRNNTDLDSKNRTISQEPVTFALKLYESSPYDSRTTNEDKPWNQLFLESLILKEMSTFDMYGGRCEYTALNYIGNNGCRKCFDFLISYDGDVYNDAGALVNHYDFRHSMLMCSTMNMDFFRWVILSKHSKHYMEYRFFLPYCEGLLSCSVNERIVSKIIEMDDLSLLKSWVPDSTLFGSLFLSKAAAVDSVEIYEYLRTFPTKDEMKCIIKSKAGSIFDKYKRFIDIFFANAINQGKNVFDYYECVKQYCDNIDFVETTFCSLKYRSQNNINPPFPMGLRNLTEFGDHCCKIMSPDGVAKLINLIRQTYRYHKKLLDKNLTDLHELVKDREDVAHFFL